MEHGGENQHEIAKNQVQNASLTCLEREMFERVARSSVIVKSQQRGEKELTVKQRIDILEEIYNKNKSTFVYKFSTVLKVNDLDLFHGNGDYDLDLYLEKLKKTLDPVTRDNVVKNRRYNYMKRVLKNSDYFMEGDLQKRNPLLYKQYIGQYKTKAEQIKEENHNFETNTFSQFLFGTIDRDLNNFRCEMELETQQNEEQEEDSDSDTDLDEDFRKCK